MNRKKALSAILVVVLVLALVPSLSIATGPSVDEVAIEAGGQKSITIDEPANNIGGTTTSGPVQIVNTDGSNSQYTVVIKAGNPSKSKNATIFFNLKDGGEKKVEVRVISGGSSGPIGGNVKSDAQAYRNIEEQWINTRVNRKATGNGVQIVYEYRDPTKGPINKTTGVPQGKWIAVSINETTGKPQYPYKTVNELLVYMSQRAHHSYAWQRNTLIAGGFIGVIPWVIAFGVLPYYRDRKSKSHWPTLGGD